MAKNTLMVLGDHFEHFVGEQVAQGRYASASEVVRAGLRLLEEREAHYAALRQALIEGEQSGIAEDSDLGKIWEEARAQGNVQAR